MQLAEIDRRELLERFPGIVFESSVVDLGVVINQELKMDAHVGMLLSTLPTSDNTPVP